MKLIRCKNSYKRTSVSKDTENLYIFTDNCDRDSGTASISDDSEYSKRFGKTGLHHPSVTSAVIRGLDNACPVTTQKGYNKGVASSKFNWDDKDFEEFKKIIDDDFEFIKNKCREKNYNAIIFPSKGVLNGSISKLTIERTPQLFNYIVKKEIELLKFNP